ncbi:MAG: hypothetical protein E7658_03695 [Ruminococcaceae bacterium]|nr:hypothetical protein [Oscillospiraceae bacterium]
MEHKIKKEKGTTALAIAVALCTLLLLTLMTVTVILTSAISGSLNSRAPLDPSVLLSEEEGSAVSIRNSIIPAFIGIGTEDSRKGISVGDNVVNELYGQLLPCLVHGLRTQPAEMTEADWEKAMSTYPYVFVQYHGPMPIEFLQASGAAEGEEMPVGDTTLLTESLFFLPDRIGGMKLLVKTTDGTVLQYTCDPAEREKYPSLETLTEWVQNFPGNFYRFSLQNSGERTEPVFLERIRVQNISMAEGNLDITDTGNPHMVRFLRFLDFNPDKLAGHTEADGTKVFVETHGVLQYRGNLCRYTASADGGVSLNSVIGYREYESACDIVRAAWTIAQRLRSATQYYQGGEADMLLTACTTDAESTTLIFSYMYDNLLFSNCEPALVITVSADHRILSLQFSAVAAMGWGEYRTVYTESGVQDQKHEAEDSMILTYPADSYDEAVFPLWTEYTRKGTYTNIGDFKR